MLSPALPVEKHGLGQASSVQAGMAEAKAVRSAERGSSGMISLTKLNDTEFVLNCDLIETIQENPDTTIRLTTGNIYIVKETMEEVVNATIRYKQATFSGLLRRD